MKQQQNVLLLVADQHRGDWLPYPTHIQAQMGLEHLPLKTPFLSQLMSCGVTFVNATSPAPLCAPARACLATGSSYAHCDIKNNDMDMQPDSHTFYQLLREAGYRVYGVGKYDLHKGSHCWAGDNGLTPLIYSLGFTHGMDSGGKMDAVNYGRFAERCEPYMRFLAQHNLKQEHVRDMLGRGKRTTPTPLPDFAYNDNFIAANAQRFLEKHPSNTPFFMQVNFSGPHGPYDVTRSMYDSVRDRTFDRPRMYCEQDGVDIRGVRRNYAAMIENIDQRCAGIVQILKNKEIFKRTTVIYCADHGEILGDRGRFEKCLPYRGSVQIPMVISTALGQHDVISRAPASLEDISNTILELALGEPSPTMPDSVSLLPVVMGEQVSVRSYSVSALDDIYIKGIKRYDGYRMIRDTQYRYMEFYDGRKELYMLDEDPFEECNIMKQQPEVAKRMQSALADLNAK